jgi:hypothetical protein
MTNDRPNLSSEGAHAIDKTILVNVNRNKYPVMRPTWALKPRLTDQLVVGRNVTLTLTVRVHCRGNIFLLIIIRYEISGALSLGVKWSGREAELQPELQKGYIIKSRHA